VSDTTFFFAGGGTGGHIYPLLSIAEQILARRPDAGIHFLHSTRNVDRRVFEKIPYARTALPATGLSFHPMKLLRFVSTFRQSYRQARDLIAARPHPVVVGAGGFVAAPVCRAGRKLGVPVALINVDLLPGRANKLSARWADEIFVQFEDSRKEFKHSRAVVTAVGCPLRSSFEHPDPDKARAELGLDPHKNVLLITGASSGSMRINEAVCELLPQLAQFANHWQIVHLTGLDNYEMVLNKYHGAQISHKVLDYYDNMADLFAATSLVVGRSGAVSIAEYAVAGVPSICMPYPHHKDRHQYFNAGKLVDAGAAVIVDDVPDLQDRAGWLWEELEDLMTRDEKLREMSQACRQFARPGAAARIAERLLQMAEC
jgi:UDP-N-acetylglucosamine--N-acetylmuramyl-(pentapeptide) pyrophosphoryl-undecaprenol N-acetylglucosamine transferase